jgi:hypothetical protein
LAESFASNFDILWRPFIGYHCVVVASRQSKSLNSSWNKCQNHKIKSPSPLWCCRLRPRGVCTNPARSDRLRFRPSLGANADHPFLAICWKSRFMCNLGDFDFLHCEILGAVKKSAMALSFAHVWWVTRVAKEVELLFALQLSQTRMPQHSNTAPQPRPMNMTGPIQIHPLGKLFQSVWGRGLAHGSDVAIWRLAVNVQRFLRVSSKTHHPDTAVKLLA